MMNDVIKTKNFQDIHVTKAPIHCELNLIDCKNIFRRRF